MVPATPDATDLDALLCAAEQARERWAAVEDVVARVRVERAAPGGEVRVTVDAQGRLVDVRFSDRARVLEPDRLSALLMAAHRRACAALHDEVEAVLPTGGAGGDAATALLDGYRRRFPPAVDERAPARGADRSWLR